MRMFMFVPILSPFLIDDNENNETHENDHETHEKDNDNDNILNYEE